MIINTDNISIIRVKEKVDWFYKWEPINRRKCVFIYTDTIVLELEEEEVGRLVILWRDRKNYLEAIEKNIFPDL